MSLVLLVVIVLIILFLIYIYQNHIFCGNNSVSNVSKPPRFKGGFKPLVFQRKRGILPSAKVIDVRETVSFNDDSDSDCEDGKPLLLDQEILRQRARDLGLYTDDSDRNIFEKTSLQIINEKVDEEAGTFGTLFRTEKALDMKNYYLRQNAEDNEFYNPDDIDALISLGVTDEQLGERTLVSRAEDESRDIVMSQIFSRIREQEAMTTEGVDDNNTGDLSQVQIVSKNLVSAGRPPASADLKKLAFESTNPVVSNFFAGLAAKDIENRKEIAGDSYGSIVDRAPIASDFY